MIKLAKIFFIALFVAAFSSPCAFAKQESLLEIVCNKNTHYVTEEQEEWEGLLWVSYFVNHPNYAEFLLENLDYVTFYGLLLVSKKKDESKFRFWAKVCVPIFLAEVLINVNVLRHCGHFSPEDMPEVLKEAFRAFTMFCLLEHMAFRIKLEKVSENKV